MKINKLAILKTPVLILTLAIALMGFAYASVVVHAQVVPSVDTNIRNNSNTVITSAPIGTVVHDSVTVASTTGPIALGTVDFSLYPNTSCSGTASVEAGVLLATGSADSATTTVPNTGLSYKVHYNGQGDVYAPADGACEVLLATAPAVTLSTTLSSTSISVGSTAYQSATLGSKTANATGTVAYSVYTNNACTVGKTDVSTKTVANGSVAQSDTFQFNTVGTLYLQANYSGDQYNSSALGPCQSISVLATSTTPVPVPTPTPVPPSATSTASISGNVYNDMNKNHAKDLGDIGLSGFTINLYKGEGWWGPRHNKSPIQSVVTDANGNYTFGSLPRGVYSIEEINKPGWKQTTGDYRRVVVTNGQQITGKDFANASSTPKQVNKEEKKKEKEEKKQQKQEERMEKKFIKFNAFLKLFDVWKSNHPNQ